MKCCVCGSEYDEHAVGACPRCGFPPILLTDDSPETREALQRTVEEYRKQLLSEFKVYITAYAYEKTSSELTEKGEQRILLAESGQLAPGTEIWSELAFEISEELLLQGEIEQNGEDRPFSLRMDPPAQFGQWRLGARMDDRLRIVMLVGGPEAVSVSEPVALTLRALS